MLTANVKRLCDGGEIEAEKLNSLLMFNQGTNAEFCTSTPLLQNQCYVPLNFKTMSKLKTAQELIKINNSSVMAGFNMFIHGYPPITFGYGHHDAYDRMQGYEFAQKMAKEDGIAFTKVFKCKQGDCHPFQYGGFFVCNNCGGKSVDKEWWKIQVEKDGNEFCCHGLDFVNLQESSNYAFGKTFEEAISNYEKVMLGVST